MVQLFLAVMGAFRCFLRSRTDTALEILALWSLDFQRITFFDHTRILAQRRTRNCDRGDAFVYMSLASEPEFVFEDGSR